MADLVLSTIYTRTGDDGTSALGDFSRVAKTDPRLVAYADTDEANAALGVAVALGELAPDVLAVVRQCQNDLFDVGADLCVPESDSAKGRLRVTQAYVDRLEAACDTFNDALPTLRSFILPGGTPARRCCTSAGRSSGARSGRPGPWSKPTRSARRPCPRPTSTGCRTCCSSCRA